MMPEMIMVALTFSRASVSSTRKIRGDGRIRKADGIEVGHAGLERFPIGPTPGQWPSDQPSNAQRKNTASRLPPGHRKSAGNGVSVAPACTLSSLSDHPVCRSPTFNEL
jgi:hypothetical protein